MKKFLFSLLAGFCVVQSQAQDTTLKQYVGRYVFPEGSFVTSGEVTLKDTVLNISSPQGASDLVKRGRDTFALLSYNGMIYFKRDGNGKVAGIKVEVDDMMAEGTKEPGTSWLPRRRYVVPAKELHAR